MHVVSCKLFAVQEPSAGALANRLFVVSGSFGFGPFPQLHWLRCELWVAKCAASDKLAEGGGERSYTCACVSATVLRLFVLFDAAFLLLQAAAVSKTSAEHSTVAFTMQTRG